MMLVPRLGRLSRTVDRVGNLKAAHVQEGERSGPGQDPNPCGTASRLFEPPYPWHGDAAAFPSHAPGAKLPKLLPLIDNPPSSSNKHSNLHKYCRIQNTAACLGYSSDRNKYVPPIRWVFLLSIWTDLSGAHLTHSPNLVPLLPMASRRDGSAPAQPTASPKRGKTSLRHPRISDQPKRAVTCHSTCLPPYLGRCLSSVINECGSIVTLNISTFAIRSTPCSLHTLR